MSDDLQDDLEAIDGIGPATASAVMAVLEDHDTGGDPMLAKAREAAREGDDRRAAIFLRRASAE